MICQANPTQVQVRDTKVLSLFFVTFVTLGGEL